MQRIALTFLFLFFAPAARAAQPCGDRLQGFTLYEVMVEDQIEARFSVFPLPDWSDASTFHGVIAKDTAPLQLEVELEGKTAVYPFAPWEKDSAWFVARGFQAKKFFRNAESGSSFNLRLKSGKKTLCEESRQILGD